MAFADLDLKPYLLQSLTEAGFVEPTRVQSEVMPDIMAGKNVIAQSQTGTGKTGAFVIPVLNMIDTRIRKPQAIIMAPTRELAQQTKDEVFNLSKHMRMRSIAVYGGTNMRKQREQLAEGPQVIIGTPGRLLDLISKGWIDLSEVKHFVLDEVDRMLDMGFVDDITSIWSSLTNPQVLAFSATVPPELQEIVTRFLGEDYVYIRATPESITVERIDDAFVLIDRKDKLEAVKHLLAKNDGKRVIIFTRTKMETGDLADALYEAGIQVGCLHGGMEQRERMRALKAFDQDQMRVLIATDVASRGLNIKRIDIVINYHVPEDPESYIHRIGRTGRNGAEGSAIMLVDHSEELLFRAVERKNKIRIKRIDMDGNPVERGQGEGMSGQGGPSRGGAGRSGGYRGRGRSGGRPSSGGGGGYRGGSSSGGGSSGGYRGSRPSGGGGAGRTRSY